VIVEELQEEVVENEIELVQPPTPAPKRGRKKKE